MTDVETVSFDPKAGCLLFLSQLQFGMHAMISSSCHLKAGGGCAEAFGVWSCNPPCLRISPTKRSGVVHPRIIDLFLSNDTEIRLSRNVGDR